MRKVKFLLITLLVSVVALTGCNKKNELSPEETLKKAQDAMKTVDNYKMDMVVSVGISGSGMTMNIDMNLNGIVDEKNGKTKMSMSTNFLGQNINTEMYTDTKTEEGKVISYTKQNDDSWTKSVSDNEDANADVAKAMQEIISSGDNLKKVKSDSKDVYTYEITIPAEKFASLMDMTGNESMSMVDKENLTGNITLKISIDKKTNNFTKFYMDMKEMLSSSMETSEEFKIEISKAEFTINFSDYNKAGDVTIPSDVIESAKDDEQGEDNNFVISYDYSAVINDKFSITIPEGFEEGLFNDEYSLEYEYETDKDKIFNSCEFSFSAIDDYTSLDKFNTDFKEGYMLDESTKKTINNLDWIIYTEENFDKTYYAITEKDEKVYLFEYSIEEDANKETCENYYNQILSSIKSK